MSVDVITPFSRSSAVSDVTTVIYRFSGIFAQDVSSVDVTYSFMQSLHVKEMSAGTRVISFDSVSTDFIHKALSAQSFEITYPSVVSCTSPSLTGTTAPTPLFSIIDFKRSTSFVRSLPTTRF